MPTTETKFVLDKNKFVDELLNNSGLGEWIDKNIRALSDPHNRGRDGNVSGYNGPKGEEDFEHESELEKSRFQIRRSMYEMYKDPNGSVATDLKAIWGFVGPVFNLESAPYEQDLLLVLKKTDVFDEEIQIGLLRHMLNVSLRNSNLRRNISEEKINALRKNVAVKMAASAKATLEDMTEASRTTHDINIIRDTVEKAKRELDAEMKKDFPDKQKISQISISAQSAARSLPSDEHRYTEAIVAEFDEGKILAAGATYVPQLQKSLEERAIESEYAQFKTQTELDQKQQEVERAKKATANADQDLENEKRKNAQLTQQLNELQRKNREQESLIKSIKMKIASLKVNFFAGGGVLKEIQSYISDVTKEY